MRQFNYFYSSYMKNKHGFISLIPHANIFHPYFGMYDIGYSGDSPTNKPYYKIIDFFNSNPLEFTHKVTMFFPEIDTGVFYIDKIKYSVDSNPKDEVKIKHEVIKNSQWYDYVPIENHLAEFEIKITVNTKYSGIHSPVEIHCDYIDILLYKQRISITETVQSIKLIPYLGLHHTNEPLRYLNYDSETVINMKNTNLTYTAIIPKESEDMLNRIKYPYSEAVSRFRFDEKGSKILFINVEAAAASYMAEEVNYFSDSPKSWPLLNNAWFLGSCAICPIAQSAWYTTVYDKNFTSKDLPGAKCIKEPCYSADETRGYVWYKVFNNYSCTKEELDSKLHSSLPRTFIDTFCSNLYDKFYKETK